jgi:hypothetical protein
MKSLSSFTSKALVVITAIIMLSACSLDITDPNAATEDEVLNSREGVTNFVVGMQGYYIETALLAIIRTPAITTRELAVSTTFTNPIELEFGGTALPESNGNVLQVWARCYRLIEMADKLIASAPDVQLTAAEEAEILALANIYKAMGLGFLIQNFEQAAINTNVDGNAEFSSRSEVLAESIRLLNKANEIISSAEPAGSFTLSGFDIPNTINALLARYNLFAGNYQDAIDAANSVDLNATSVFTYDGTTSQNPIYGTVYISEDYLPRDSLGTPLAEAGDKRLDFYLIETNTTSQANNLPSDFLAGFWDALDKNIPVYLPDEMTLIKAEAHVRMDPPQLAQAVIEINAVRTQAPADDPFGVGADLPPYAGPVTEEALLEEIYYQRSAEMYLSGMRFEDMRRLNRPVPSDDPPLTAPRNRVYYPYPTQERQNNSNTPPNPAI